MQNDKIVESIDAMIRSLEQFAPYRPVMRAPLKRGSSPSERSGLAPKRRKVSAAGRARMAAAREGKMGQSEVIRVDVHQSYAIAP